MSNAVKLSPRPRKHKKSENMKQEIVAQVHRHNRSTTSSDNDYANSEDNLEVPKSDKNENYSLVNTPSREISVDGEAQINSKIISLIETEMKKDINRHSHFTESRPQSLSFYEDEKMPEELSGNLELLSPEEKKHYRKRKEYSQMDIEERNAYNAIQDLYNSRDPEEILNSSTKKSKSRKKKYGESEQGIGDSREMMIPKEKRKSKKKRREASPSSSNTKRKHKTRTREDEHQPRSEVTLALEELQDDVFENTLEDFGNKAEKMKKSPRRSDKVYVQKKSRFEEVSRHNNIPLSRQSAQDLDSVSNLDKRISSRYPIEVAIVFQKWWMRLSSLCHGLLGGLGLGHWLYLVCNFHTQDQAFLTHYAYYSDIYVGLFFALCVLCIISVFDRMDVGHLDTHDLTQFFKQKKYSLLVIVYMVCLTIHLLTTPYDEKLALLAKRNHSDIGDLIENTTDLGGENNVFRESEITLAELKTWNHLSLWRSLLAFTAFIILGISTPEDMLYNHLKSMEEYLPSDT
ncbi:DNA ligase 1 [Euwallacea fornicatus]|uniref:DNA ligase 1 n=1 Tax=Euwallacea fornicatus TaxID=995702 RepID=UPI003390535D